MKHKIKNECHIFGIPVDEYLFMSHQEKKVCENRLIIKDLHNDFCVYVHVICMYWRKKKKTIQKRRESMNV